METTNIPENFYFHGYEIEQFIHIQVPLILIKERVFKNISNTAKLLYGLLLNRTGLSIRSGWLDENDRTYITYTIENVMEDLCVGSTMAKKMFAELSDIDGTGIGLIKKVRVLNKPSRIYVMNFMEVYHYLVNTEAEKEQEENENVDNSVDNNVDNSTEKSFEAAKEQDCVPPSDGCVSHRRTDVCPTVGQMCVPPSDRHVSTNNNYIINKDNNNIDCININHINLYEDTDELSTQTDLSYRIEGDDDQRQSYIELIKKNIEYDHVLKYPREYDVDMYTNILHIICDVVCVPRDVIRINNYDYPYEVVQSVFLKIKSSHIEYVLQCMHNNPTKINNIKAYIMTALYNAVLTMDLYYKAEVNHDLYGY